MRLRTKVTLTLVAVALGGLWLATPALIKWRVHARYPDVTVDTASLNGLGVHLTGIHIDRGWMKGDLESATVSFTNEDVTIDGGDLSVVLDDRPSGGAGGEGHTILFSHLTLHAAKGHAHADVHGFASGPDNTICWEDADVSHTRLKYPAHVGGGCAAKDGSWVKIQAGTFDLYDTPYLAAGAGQSFDGLTYTKDKSVDVESIELNMMDPRGEPFPVTAKGVHVTLGGSTRVISADTVEVEHAMLRTRGPDPNEWRAVTFHHVEAYEDGPNVYDISVNGLHLVIDHDPGHLAMWGKQPCQDWVDALPDGLREPPLDGLKLTGEFVFDLKLKPRVDLTIGAGSRGNGCKVTTCDPIRALRKTFTYITYDPKAGLVQRTTGPQMDLPTHQRDLNWIHLADTGPMPMAVINTEDYLFRQHGGFIPRALQDSLQADMDAGKFVRGGSTIEMQLAKNLWLDRTKTLGRKAQELFLAMALDSCLTKDEILETYLNVVEFGPGIYGIWAGSHYWFKKEPSELQPVEAFWLASILPHPETAGPPTPAALKATNGLMRMLNKEGRIPSLADTVPDDTAGWVVNQ